MNAVTADNSQQCDKSATTKITLTYVVNNFSLQLLPIIQNYSVKFNSRSNARKAPAQTERTICRKSPKASGRGYRHICGRVRRRPSHKRWNYTENTRADGSFLNVCDRSSSSSHFNRRIHTDKRFSFFSLQIFYARKQIANKPNNIFG